MFLCHRDIYLASIAEARLSVVARLTYSPMRPCLWHQRLSLQRTGGRSYERALAQSDVWTLWAVVNRERGDQWAG